MAAAVAPWELMAAHFPETPFLMAGLFGGPVVFGGATPMRNALTLATQNKAESIQGLYGRVFQGTWRGGYVGWLPPTMSAAPQFVVMGPVYHMYAGAFGSPIAAIAATGATETMITFGAQARNAQIAFNATVPKEQQIRNLQSPYKPFGCGAAAHMVRNVVGLSGIRVVSPPLQRALTDAADSSGMNPGPKAMSVVGDLLGCCVSGTLSMPFHQLYNYTVVTPSIHKLPAPEFGRACVDFWKRMYLETNAETGAVRLSRTLRRDLLLRVSYSMAIFAGFAQVERLFLATFSHFSL